jgi:hypothetical protein
MSRRTADDLDDDPAAIGGAMSKWPRRTVAWACRDDRVGAADPGALAALLDREAADLADLREKARRNAIDVSTLDRRRAAIEAARTDVDGLLRELRRAYREEYGDGDGWDGDDGCPFEQSGLDKACWRCPVPGAVLDRMGEGEGDAADEDGPIARDGVGR